jgi:hypothetical protein
MLEHAKQAIGKHDPEGKDCNCIAQLIIANHGGGGGEIRLGDISYDATTYATALRLKSGLSQDNYEKYLAARSYARDALVAHNILSQIAKLKCKHIKVVILACNAGEGEAGKALRQQMGSIFGPNATIVTYEGKCGFSPIFNTPMPKWDLFNSSKKKEQL